MLSKSLLLTSLPWHQLLLRSVIASGIENECQCLQAGTFCAGRIWSTFVFMAGTEDARDWSGRNFFRVI